MRWEIIYKATEYIAEEAGIALRNSAFSPNIRERMDHSVAVVDAEGRIVAQAEHIPVHLGSFHIGIINLLKALEGEGLEEGDAVLTNDPYIAGTHLNDVLVLYPVYWRERLVAYIASKAHYVDVGGPLPASLNPRAKTIYEEGVVIPPVKILKRGQLNREALSFILENFKTPEVAKGDLEAQLAASRVGAARVRELFERYGEKVLDAWREAVEYGRRLTLGEISKWPRGRFDAVDYLDWRGELLPMRVTLEVGDGGVRTDFTGTARQVDAPINAVFGVTYSAVSFAVRAALAADVPTNHGFYSVIKVEAPLGTIVNPVKPAAVGAGNLETSQRVADAVFMALSKALPGRIPAAGSGTMMNVMIGGVWRGRYWSYYETIGGGTGGRPNSPGVSGVHVNMTNTLNTPIEIAERTYPIKFTAYRIREGSGGSGRYRGGDGIVRAFKTLAPATLSIIASRFDTRPWGLEGGCPGKPARVVVKRRRGGEVAIRSDTVELDEGDEVIIETPGGGGYGSAGQLCD
ncbi:5-oxoprolinase (ATP-hydrolyzing) [Pyrobaculum islandicum DSM 4184]|uniref:5-oxoprolinase (ATP-hydrolyzing) n=1 Tax=Pyrobaculum islandicum (strain DSM 4184 / JCM 9189 / GEO3) TaxID=384616 RepID=A1RQT2_PYRIL|nr:hydantoinase B/oxoprolinase family protein [Pyrobaculum islandicum]ABL87314.1 5-oxoprolinase (ATP-hydrolyzing) [Pyrobaculum islandicum DSM 4184]